MAESLNVCTVSGNLGKEAELRLTPTGMAVVTFRLAVNRRRKMQDGSYEDETSWVPCVMFGKRGEALQQGGYLPKGARVAVTGHLRESRWEKDGQQHSKLELFVDNIVGMTQYRKGQQSAPATAAAATAATMPMAQQPEQQGLPMMPSSQAPNIYDDDIPF